MSMDKKLSLLIHFYIYIYKEFQSITSVSNNSSLLLNQHINHLSHLINIDFSLMNSR